MNADFWYKNCFRLAVLAVLAFTLAFFSVVSQQILQNAPADWYSDSEWAQAYLKSMLLLMPVPLLLCGWVAKTLLKTDPSSAATDRENRLQWEEVPVLTGIYAFLIAWTSVCAWVGVSSWQKLQYQWNLDSTIAQMSTDRVRIIRADVFLGEEADYHEMTRLSRLSQRQELGGGIPRSKYFHVVGNCFSIQVLDKGFDDTDLVNMLGALRSRGLLEKHVWCMDLSGSRVTDHAIRFLSEPPSNEMTLRALIARDTELTSQSLNKINKLGLTVLDVRGTPIRLSDFEDFNHSGFDALKALYLSGDPVSEAAQPAARFYALEYLILKGLQYLILNDEKTTQAAIGSLANGLPNGLDNVMVAPPLNFFQL